MTPHHITPQITTPHPITLITGAPGHVHGGGPAGLRQRMPLPGGHALDQARGGQALQGTGY